MTLVRKHNKFRTRPACAFADQSLFPAGHDRLLSGPGVYIFGGELEPTGTVMLKLSDILVAHKEIESFEALLPLEEVARSGERFFRMNVTPPYPDTPEDWEDRLEAAFSGLIR